MFNSRICTAKKDFGLSCTWDIIGVVTYEGVDAQSQGRQMQLSRDARTGSNCPQSICD